MFSSEYAAFSSVRPMKLKSMIPFCGCTNRHASLVGDGVVGTIVEVVPRRNIS